MATRCPGQPLQLVVERNGRLPLTITPTAITEDGETAGFLDFVPDYGEVPVIVRELLPNSPATEAGLQLRDVILAVNGQPVHSAEHVSQYIRDHKNQPITLTINRAGQRMDITATARKLSDGKERLGFTPDEEIPLQPGGLASAATYAVNSNLEILRLTGKALGQVVTGQRSARNTLSGPIGIYNAAAASVERLGWAGVACSGSSALILAFSICYQSRYWMVGQSSCYCLKVCCDDWFEVVNDSARAYSASRVCHGNPVDGLRHFQ